MIVCKLCKKHYIGRTCRQLRDRVGEHRRSFYKLCDKKPYDQDSDEFALAQHLYIDHNLSDKPAFNLNYMVTILCFSSPKALDVKEHKFIHNLNSLSPFGLNLNNPFSIPLLHR